MSLIETRLCYEGHKDRLDVYVKECREGKRKARENRYDIPRCEAGDKDHTRMTARSKARRTTMRMIMHQPDLVSSVS